MGVNGNANSSEVLLQDGGTRPASTSGRWITPLDHSASRDQLLNSNLLLRVGWGWARDGCTQCCHVSHNYWVFSTTYCLF